MNKDESAYFRDRVYAVVAQIPVGRVMTYGDIAALAGSAHAARIVGGIAHFGPTDLPWQRVVNRFGGLASGYYGGRAQQQKDLEAEGIVINDFIVVDFATLRWSPYELENGSDE
jgi:methylated-DNA-protein-cysteine methyltransferase-like protein